MHIFISYAKADARNIAKQIFTRLNSMDDVSAWMDTSLVPAESWAQQIQQELDRSDLVIVIITPDVNRPKGETQSSSFVLKEINYAQARHKPVLPVMGNFTHLPVQIADLEYIDFSRSIEEGMNRLADYVLDITGGKAPPKLEPWQEKTIDSSTRRIPSSQYTPSNADASVPLDWTPPRPIAVQPHKEKQPNPWLGLVTGVMGGCVVGGILLAAVVWAVFNFVVDDSVLSDADATATSEAEMTASVTTTATVTRTSTRIPTSTTITLPTATRRPFVPSSTPVFIPSNTFVPPPTSTFVPPTPTFVIPTNTIVFPTPTPFIPTSTWVPTPTPAP
jgi:hypothetical protein